MGDTDIETMANVTIAKYDFDHDAFANISEDAKDFIRCLLVKDKEYVSLVIFEEYYVVPRWRGFMLKYPNHVANYDWQKTNVNTDTFAKLVNERSCPDNEMPRTTFLSSTVRTSFAKKIQQSHHFLYPSITLFHFLD